MADDSPDTALQPISDTNAGYSRVTAAQVSLILQLRRERPTITQAELGQILGVHQTTIGYWLRELTTDTVQDARALAKAKALKATLKIADHVENSDPRVSLGAAKAITALAGVAEGIAPVQVGVQVIVGNTGQPAGQDPFDNVIESKPIESDS